MGSIFVDLQVATENIEGLPTEESMFIGPPHRFNQEGNKF